LECAEKSGFAHLVAVEMRRRRWELDVDKDLEKEQLLMPYRMFWSIGALMVDPLDSDVRNWTSP
jgi:hypothetical protein